MFLTVRAVSFCSSLGLRERFSNFSDYILFRVEKRAISLLTISIPALKLTEEISDESEGPLHKHIAGGFYLTMDMHYSYLNCNACIHSLLFASFNPHILRRKYPYLHTLGLK